MRFVYPGFPAYLDRAALAMKVGADVVGHARRIPALARMASLIGQACDADRFHTADILRHARESRDAIAVALEAANHSLLDAHKGVGLEPPDFTPAELLEARAEIAKLKALLNECAIVAGIPTEGLDLVMVPARISASIDGLMEQLTSTLESEDAELPIPEHPEPMTAEIAEKAE